jgi:hypothetical protein
MRKTGTQKAATAPMSIPAVVVRPANVPPLSSDRIRKREGIRWRRARPWYFITGARVVAMVTTRRGRLLQRLVSQLR